MMPPKAEELENFEVSGRRTAKSPLSMISRSFGNVEMVFIKQSASGSVFFSCDGVCHQKEGGQCKQEAVEENGKKQARQGFCAKKWNAGPQGEDDGSAQQA